MLTKGIHLWNYTRGLHAHLSWYVLHAHTYTSYICVPYTAHAVYTRVRKLHWTARMPQQANVGSMKLFHRICDQTTQSSTPVSVWVSVCVRANRRLLIFVFEMYVWNNWVEFTMDSSKTIKSKFCASVWATFDSIEYCYELSTRKFRCPN